ncbi:MAG: hypothetical protein Tsb002_12130 [Wenzhouxiangellaceae bacterium]
MTTTLKDKRPTGFSRVWLTACFALLALSGCGGGGGDTGGGFQAPDPIRVTISATSLSVPANPLERLPDTDSPFTIQVNVRVVTNTNAPVADGTIVNLTANNLAIGGISTLDDPETDDLNEFTTLFGQISAETAGGNATFFFTSGRQTGTTLLTASAADPNSQFTASATQQITVTPSPADNRITFEATRTTIPANTDNVPIFFGSPFISEVTLRFRGIDGDFTSPQGGNFNVGISPVTVAAFSTLDDPETDDVNEFFVLLGNGPVSSAAGQATVFVHSGDVPGTVTLTVTAADPQTGEEFSAQFPLEIVANAATGLPSTASLTQPANPVFIQGSGGTTSKPLSVSVLDSGNQPVPDPVAGTNRFNNVIVTLTPPENNGSRLSGVDANGNTVGGLEISLATTNGVTQFGFNSGTTTGLHRVTATVDRADNNVDNGIQDGLSSIEEVIVGDGQLAGLRLASPIINAININRVIDQIDPDEDIMVDPDTGLLIPPDPDATYALTISVTSSDSVGGPVITGTNLQLGKIDEPLAPNNGSVFNFSGVTGNPVEGGLLFSDDFTIDGFLDEPGVDEAVQPGDLLLTFGEEVPGNNELESARIVDTIPTNTIINVTQAFNNNDGSGVIVDDGRNIPYVIGRSTIGSVPPSLQTEQDGVDEFVLTYPASAVGRPLAIFVQGNRTDNGEVQTVADVALLNFPGIAPATLAVLPNTIRGNSTVPITLCVADALSVPVQNVPISFTTNGLGNFEVSNDPLITGGNGCVTTNATSSGLSFGQDDLLVTFAGAGTTALLTVTPPQTAFISASPSLINITATASRSVLVTVVDENDNPVPNLQIDASCDSPVTVTPGTASTDVDGEAVFTLSTDAMPDPMNGPETGTCTFSADIGMGGTISTTIVFNIPVIPVSP